MISGMSAILMDTFPLHKLSVSNYVFRGGVEGEEEIEQKGSRWAVVCVETM